MRQLSRIARRTALQMRRPPRPRALVAIAVAAGILGVGAAVAIGLVYAWQSGLAAEIGGWPTQVARVIERRLDLRIRTVETLGRARTSRTELLRELASLEGQYILTVDLDAVRERLRDLPWVRRASVRRLLPATILVELEEYEPAAIWRSDRGPRLIDRDGEIIPVDDLAPWRHLPVVAGAKAPQRLGSLLSLLAHEPEIARRFTSAALIGGRRWNLLLDDRLEVRLPEHDPERALRLLVREHARSRLLDRAVEAIDLRADSWLVLRPLNLDKTRAGRKAA